MDNFFLWLESNSAIRWEDGEGNPIEGPAEGEDCFAILSDGSKVVFDLRYDVVRVTYNNKSPKDQVGDAVEAFADANPEQRLDGMYLDNFLKFYKEVKPNIYQRFEPKAGDRLGDGDTYEPDRQPDLSDFIMQKSMARYPGGSITQITPATGYVLADGRTVPMGRGNNRDDDHRFMVPSEKAMEKWGWPKTNSETEKMYELMRRSGAARIIISEPLVISLTAPLTKQQRQVIRKYIQDKNVKGIIVSFAGGREYEFTTKDHRQMDRYL